MIQVTCAIIRNEDNEVLIVQRGEKTDHPFKWEFPGGKMRDGETEEECIIREIREELSMEVIIFSKAEQVVHDYGHKEITLIPCITDKRDESNLFMTIIMHNLFCFTEDDHLHGEFLPDLANDAFFFSLTVPHLASGKFPLKRVICLFTPLYDEHFVIFISYYGTGYLDHKVLLYEIFIKRNYQQVLVLVLLRIKFACIMIQSIGDNNIWHLEFHIISCDLVKYFVLINFNVR